MNSAAQALEYYLSLPYPFEVYPLKEGGWFVKFPDLLGCMTDADNWEDLPARMDEVKRLWIESVLASHHPIPEPSEK